MGYDRPEFEKRWLVEEAIDPDCIEGFGFIVNFEQ